MPLTLDHVRYSSSNSPTSAKPAGMVPVDSEVVSDTIRFPYLEKADLINDEDSYLIFTHTSGSLESQNPTLSPVGSPTRTFILSSPAVISHIQIKYDGSEETTFVAFVQNGLVITLNESEGEFVENRDYVTSVSSSPQDPLFAWARNDKWSTRFKWDGIKQSWKLTEGSKTQLLGTIGESLTYPESSLFSAGDTLPGSSLPYEWSILRIGESPSERSFSLGKGSSEFAPPIFISDESISSYVFEAGGPSAVISESGSIRFNPIIENRFSGVSVWCSHISPQESPNVGLLEDILIDPVYISPIPSPAEAPVITIGSRLPLRALRVETESDLFAAPVSEGTVVFAASTGMIRLSASDINKADPFSPDFDPSYYKEPILYRGLYNNVSGITYATSASLNIAGNNQTPSVIPSSSDSLLVSRGRFYFRFNGEDLRFRANNRDYRWTPPTDVMTTQQVVDSINQLDPLVRDVQGHVVFTVESSIEYPGNSGDLFLPGWVSSGNNPDSGMGIQLEITDDTTFTTIQKVSGNLNQSTPLSPFAILPVSPLLDLPGFSTGHHLRLNGVDLIPWENVKYEFDQSRIVFISQVQEQGNITVPVSSIQVPTTIVPESLAEWGSIGFIELAQHDEPLRRLLPSEYRVSDQGGIQILDLITSVVYQGSNGTISGNSFYDLDNTFIFSGKPLYLRILSGDYEGYYKVDPRQGGSVTLNVTLSDSTNIPYQLIEASSTSVVADALYRNLPMYDEDPFAVYKVIPVSGTTPQRTLPTIPEVIPEFINESDSLTTVALSRINLGALSNGMSLQGFDTNQTFDVLIAGIAYPVSAANTEPLNPTSIQFWNGLLYFPASLISEYAGTDVILAQRFSSTVASGVVEWKTSTADIKTNETIVFWKQKADATVNPSNGSFLIRPLNPGDRILVSYLPDNNGIPGDRIEEFLPFFVTSEVATRSGGSSYTFNPDNRERVGSVDVFVGGFKAGYANSTKFSVLENTIIFEKPVDPTLTVTVNYQVSGAIGGESNGTVSSPPVYKPNLLIPAGESTFEIESPPADLLPDSIVRVGSSILSVSQKSGNTITFTPTTTAAIGSASPGADLLLAYTEPLNRFRNFWQTVGAVIDPITKGSTSIRVRDTLNVSAGFLAEINGVVFNIASVEFSMGDTILTLASSNAYSIPSPVVRISTRPVYLEGTKQFVVPSNLLDYRVVRMMGNVGQELIAGVDYQIDAANGILSLMDNQSGLTFGESIWIDGDRGQVLSPVETPDGTQYPRISVRYSQRDLPPSQGPLSIEAFVYQPDQFSFSLRDFDVRKDEYRQEVESNQQGVQSNSIVKDQVPGRISEAEQFRIDINQDGLAAVILSEIHLVANGVALPISRESGSMWGGLDGPFKYDVGVTQRPTQGNVFSLDPVIIPWAVDDGSESINDIDDLVLEIPKWKSGPDSRFNPSTMNFLARLTTEYPFFAARRFYRGGFISTTGKNIGQVEFPYGETTIQPISANVCVPSEFGISDLGESVSSPDLSGFEYSSDYQVLTYPRSQSIQKFLFSSINSDDLFANRVEFDEKFRPLVIGKDIQIDSDGTIVDITLPSIKDPAIIPRKELSGQATLVPGSTLNVSAKASRVETSSPRYPAVVSLSNLSDDQLSNLVIETSSERVRFIEELHEGLVLNAFSGSQKPAVLYYGSSLGSPALAIIEVGQAGVPAGMTGIFEIHPFEDGVVTPRLITEVSESSYELVNAAVWGDSYAQGLSIGQIGSGPYQTSIIDAASDISIRSIISNLNLSGTGSTVTFEILRRNTDPGANPEGSVQETLVIEKTGTSSYEITSSLATQSVTLSGSTEYILTLTTTNPVIDFSLFDSIGTAISGVRNATLSYSMVESQTLSVEADRCLLTFDFMVTLSRPRGYTLFGINRETSFEMIATTVGDISGSTANNSVNVNDGVPFTFPAISAGIIAVDTSRLILPSWEGKGNIPLSAASIKMTVIPYQPDLTMVGTSAGKDRIQCFLSAHAGRIVYVRGGHYSGMYIVRGSRNDVTTIIPSNPESPFYVEFPNAVAFSTTVQYEGEFNGAVGDTVYLVINEGALASSDPDVYSQAAYSFTITEKQSDVLTFSNLEDLAGNPVTISESVSGYLAMVQNVPSQGIDLPLSTNARLESVITGEVDTSSAPYDYEVRGDYDSEIVYEDIPRSLLVSAFDLDAVHDPNGFGGGIPCFLKGDVIQVTEDRSTLFLEPFYPTPNKDLGDGIPNVYSESHKGVRIGMFDTTDFGVPPNTEEELTVTAFPIIPRFFSNAAEWCQYRWMVPTEASVLNYRAQDNSVVLADPLIGSLEFSAGDRIDVYRGDALILSTRITVSQSSSNTAFLQEGADILPGDLCKILRKGSYQTALQAAEEAVESIFDVVFESSVDFATQDGAFCDQADVLSDTSVSSFLSEGVKVGDIVYVPPSGQLQGTTGVADPIEYGQPFFLTGLDDNRGAYLVGQVYSDGLAMESLSKILRVTAYANGSNSFRWNTDSIAPFPYRVLRVREDFQDISKMDLIEVLNMYSRLQTYEQRSKEFLNAATSYVDSQRRDLFDDLDQRLSNDSVLGMEDQDRIVYQNPFSTIEEYNKLQDLALSLLAMRYRWIDRRMDAASGTISLRSASHIRYISYQSKL